MNLRAQGLGDSRDSGRPGLPVLNSPDRFCRCRATFEEDEAALRTEFRGCLKVESGRPGLPVPNSPHGLCERKETMNVNETSSEFTSCVKVEVAVLGSPSPNIVLMVCVDVKQH